jgi:hypothetical protein
VIRHRLWATRIAGKRCGRDLELLRQPLNKRLDGLLQQRQGDPGMAKQGELHSKADPIGISATFRHKVLIGARQGKAPRHAVGIERNAEQSSPLLVGQQSLMHHPSPPIKGRRPYEVAVRQTTVERSMPECPETLDLR